MEVVEFTLTKDWTVNATRGLLQEGTEPRLYNCFMMLHIFYQSVIVSAAVYSGSSIGASDTTKLLASCPQPAGQTEEQL